MRAVFGILLLVLSGIEITSALTSPLVSRSPTRTYPQIPTEEQISYLQKCIQETADGYKHLMAEGVDDCRKFSDIVKTVVENKIDFINKFNNWCKNTSEDLTTITSTSKKIFTQCGHIETENCDGAIESMEYIYNYVIRDAEVADKTIVTVDNSLELTHAYWERCLKEHEYRRNNNRTVVEYKK